MRLITIAVLILALAPQAHAEIDERLVGWWEMITCNDAGLGGCPNEQDIYFRADGTYRLLADEVIEEGPWATVPCGDLIHSDACRNAWDFAIVLGELQPTGTGETGGLLVRIDGQTFESIADVATDGALVSWSYLGPVGSAGTSWSALKADFR